MHGRTTHVRGRASVLGGPDASSGFRRRHVSQGGPKKGSMRAGRGCCSFFFSGRSLRPILSGVVLGVTLHAAAQGVAFPGGAWVETGSQAERLQAGIAAVQPANGEAEPQQQENNGKPLMSGSADPAATSSMPVAPMFSRVIPAGMATPQIHKWDKITLATRNLYSATSIVSFVTSAGWDQLTNGQPNYGTNSRAFGQRVGAAVIRDSSQAFLSNGPFAVWLHQDPRYFALGAHHSIPKRAWYAVTRALVTRDSTDGHAELNTSLILGQAAGTALNNLYYPKSNRNFHDNLAGFGGSMGGAALSFAMDEFT